MSKFDPAKFCTVLSKARKPSPIRQLVPLMKMPGMVSLGSGMPNPTTFPFKTISAELVDGSTINLSEKETAAALQYTLTSGLPELKDWLQKFQKIEHSPVYKDWDICIGTGSQDVLTNAFDMLLEDGDSILIDAPTYPGTLAYLQPRDLDIIPVETDGYGMIPSSLEDRIHNNKARKLPKVMMTIPTGQNPSGCTLSLQRRHEIMRIVKENDLVVVGDDPYYYLMFGEYPFKANTFKRADIKLPSLFSLDTEGRVIRTDSLSKVVSSGIRIGWVTAHKEFINRIVLGMQATTLHASAVSHAIVAKWLDSIGVDGFMKHLDDVAIFYGQKRDLFNDICKEHLVGKADWHVPHAGLFYWLDLHGQTDTGRLVLLAARQGKVLLLPGRVFNYDNSESSHVRVAFSLLGDEQLNDAVQRFAGVLEVQQTVKKLSIQKVQQITTTLRHD